MDGNLSDEELKYLEEYWKTEKNEHVRDYAFTNPAV